MSESASSPTILTSRVCYRDRGSGDRLWPRIGGKRQPEDGIGIAGQRRGCERRRDRFRFHSLLSHADVDTDGEAQVAEIPKVWNLVVRPRLTTSTTRVIMFPEDPSRTSVSFAFAKSAGGEWIAEAPWRIVIPAN